jgi:hypothetical protein
MRRIGVLASLAAALLGSCRTVPVQERFEIPEGVTAPWAAVGAGGSGWAYAELSRAEAFLVANGRRMGPYS